jgi:hypothetical protein
MLVAHLSSYKENFKSALPQGDTYAHSSVNGTKRQMIPLHINLYKAKYSVLLKKLTLILITKN